MKEAYSKDSHMVAHNRHCLFFQDTIKCISFLSQMMISTNIPILVPSFCKIVPVINIDEILLPLTLKQQPNKIQHHQRDLCHVSLLFFYHGYKDMYIYILVYKKLIFMLNQLSSHYIT